jgi:hypothetical protein
LYLFFYLAIISYPEMAAITKVIAGMRLVKALAAVEEDK